MISKFIIILIFKIFVAIINRWYLKIITFLIYIENPIIYFHICYINLFLNILLSGKTSGERLRSINRDILYEHIGSFRGHSNAEAGGTDGIQTNIRGTRMDYIAFSS